MHSKIVEERTQLTTIQCIMFKSVLYYIEVQESLFFIQIYGQHEVPIGIANETTLINRGRCSSLNALRIPYLIRIIMERKL